MNLTSLNQMLRSYEAAIAARPDQYEAVVNLAKLQRSVGFRSSALANFRKAQKLGVPFKLVGHLIAELENLTSGARAAADYLQSQYDADENAGRYHRRNFEVYRFTINDSDSAFNRASDGSVSPEVALIDIDKHLKAREFERIVATIENFNLNTEKYPRVENLYGLAQKVLAYRTRSADVELAVGLASHYSIDRRPVEGAAILADYNVYQENSFCEIDKLTTLLSELGNDLVAAKHAGDYLEFHPENPTTKYLAIRFAAKLGDKDYLSEIANIETVADNLIDALRNYSLYLSIDRENLSNKKASLVESNISNVLARQPSSQANNNHRLSEISLAAFLCNPRDQFNAIGFGSEAMRGLATHIENHNLPTFDTLVRLKNIGIKANFGHEASVGRSFDISLLQDICRTVTSFGSADSIDDGLDSDEIISVLPSTGTFRPTTPTKLIGTTDDKWANDDFSQSFEAKSVELACVKGASLIGRGLVLNRDGIAIVDVQNDSIRRNFPINRLKDIKSQWWAKAHLQSSANGKGFKYAASLNPISKIIDQPCYLLDNGQGYNFANWHMYVFPRLYGYFKAGLDASNVKLLVYKGTSDRLINMLKGFGLSEDLFYFHDPMETTIFENLYVPTAMSDVERLLVPEAFRIFDRLTVEYLNRSGLRTESRWTHGSLPRKVYLSRSDVPRRRLINEARIEEIARNNGYEVILPAELSLIDVVNLYRNVDVICGPSGSSFLNMLLMKPKSKAIMISHPLYSPTAYLCCQFGGLRNVEAQIIFGKVEGGVSRTGHQEAFSVDEQAVNDLLAIS